MKFRCAWLRFGPLCYGSLFIVAYRSILFRTVCLRFIMYRFVLKVWSRLFFVMCRCVTRCIVASRYVLLCTFRYVTYPRVSFRYVPFRYVTLRCATLCYASLLS